MRMHCLFIEHFPYTNFKIKGQRERGLKMLHISIEAELQNLIVHRGGGGVHYTFLHVVYFQRQHRGKTYPL